VPREQHAGIEDARRVERALHRTHRVDLPGASREVKPLSLREADAVLGADAAAELGDELEHGVVDAPVAGLGVEHVHVEVAVAEMPEENHARCGCSTSHARADVTFEVRQSGDREGDVQLVRDAFGLDRLRMALPVRPEGVTVARGRRDGRLDDACGGDRPGELLQRIVPGGALDERT
jgi:hypothetical protein